MPLRMLHDDHKGWYGKESRWQNSIRLTRATIYSQRAKNELIKSRHAQQINKIELDEKHVKERHRKAARRTQIELVQIKAYGAALSEYSFTESQKEDNKNEVKENFPMVSKSARYRQPEKSFSNNLSFCRPRPTTTDGPRPTNNGHKLKRNIITPTLSSSTGVHENHPKQPLRESVITAEESQQNSGSGRASKVQEKQVKIPASLFLTETIEESEEEDDDDKDTNETFGLSYSHTENNNKMKSASVPLMSSDMQTLQEKRAKCAESNAWKLALFRSYTKLDANRQLSAGDHTTQSNGILPKRKLKKQEGLKLWENYMSRSERVSNVFPPNCRSVFTLRKMVNDKAEKLIKDWSPDNILKSKAHLILERMRNPTVITRQKTTSAIMRDYRRCKSQHRSLDDYPKTLVQKQNIVY